MHPPVSQNPGNFAGGRKELAMRLLSMQSPPPGSTPNPETEINPVLDHDLSDEDEDEEIPRNHRFANMPASLISGRVFND